MVFIFREDINQGDFIGTREYGQICVHRVLGVSEEFFDGEYLKMAKSGPETDKIVLHQTKGKVYKIKYEDVMCKFHTPENINYKSKTSAEGRPTRVLKYFRFAEYN